MPYAESLDDEHGFSLIEFLISSFLLILISSWTFTLLSEIQQEAGYQTEVLSVLNNSQYVMHAIQRHFRQAGNDPLASGFQGITPISSSEMRLHTDIKGKIQKNKGDPDGDFEDSDEDVLIRYNAKSRSVEIIPGDGPAQIIGNYISHLSFQYYNAEGEQTDSEDTILRIDITVSGASAIRHPKTHQYFGVELKCSVRKIS